MTGSGDGGAELEPRCDENTAPVVLSLDILRVTREAQQQHGLRHGDYQRYRGYCSRRVRRLRKVLRIPQGDRRHYRRRDVTAAHLAARAAEARLLCIPLAQAERAWAHAMQLRQEANTEPRKRFHLVQRLRKATAHAGTLLQLAESGMCCARTQLEAQAYAAWLQGALQLELQAWPAAAEQLARAQLVYQQLGATLSDHERALYLQKAEELTPSLRYCAYNIGDESAAAELRELRGRGLPDDVHALMAAAARGRGAAPHEVAWRGRRVAVRPERARQLLAGLRDVPAALAAAAAPQDKIDVLESALMDCKDAAAAVRDDIRTDPALKGADGGAVPSAQLLLSYVTYLRLTNTVARNNLLVQQAEAARRQQQQLDGKKVRAQDLARLYEIILQNYAELAALPGLEGDAAYQAEVARQAGAYRALRCYYIAQALCGLRRWREALAMLERSTAYATAAEAEAGAAGAEEALEPELRDKLRALHRDVASCQFEVHANSVLEAEGEAAGAGAAAGAGGRARAGAAPAARKPLAERLEEFGEEGAGRAAPLVFRAPPAMQAAPCKPLLFDLACNLVAFPALEAAGGGERGGLSRLVSGFLGWGKRDK